jgi:hypothetical protein
LLVSVVIGCGRIHFDAAVHTGDGALDDGHEQPPSEAAIASGLLVWLRMDDDPTIASDSSGHGHAAPCTPGECPALVTGRVGSAYRFDGVQDLLALPYDPSLATPSAFTIAFWFQLDPTGNQVCFSSKQSGDGYSWSIELDTSKAPMVYTGVAPTDDRLYDFTAATVGRWTHLATTWDGSTKRLYIDGVMQSQSAFSAITFDTNDIYFGIQRRINPTQFYYPMVGSLDEMLIYDRALSANEIATLAQ